MATNEKKEIDLTNNESEVQKESASKERERVCEISVKNGSIARSVTEDTNGIFVMKSH